MADKKPPIHEVDAPPSEYAQVPPPRDLHPTSDIRFVIQEVAKLSTQVERLISDVKDLSGKVNPGQVERLVADLKATSDKVDQVQLGVSYVKGALKTVGIFFGAVIAIAGLVIAGIKVFSPSPAVPVPLPAAASAPAATPAASTATPR